MNFVNDLYNAINEEKVTISVITDLRKAFDTVNHQILGKELENYAVKGQNINWIRSYLTDRRQSEIDILWSTPRLSSRTTAVPIVYVNDMKRSIKTASYKSLVCR